SQLSRSVRRRVAERRALEQFCHDGLGAHVSGEIERIDEVVGLGGVRRAISDAVERLSAEQAYAVQQRVIQGRGYDDLAAELGVSEQVVRARVSRGLRSLAAAVI